MSESAPSTDSQRLLNQPDEVLAELFAKYRERLLRIVQFRLDARLRRRLDPVDVLQEAYLQISKRLTEFLENPAVSCFVWMRQQTLQTMIDLQRAHFREKRSPVREVIAAASAEEDGTSVAIAQYLIAEMTSPSMAMQREEDAQRLRQALSSMNELDREVLALRHFELLGNQEVAESLGLSPSAASNRYVRAMARLSEILRQFDHAENDSGESP